MGAILNSAHVLLRDKTLSHSSTRTTIRLQRSAERVKVMIDDLFVFTRTRLGDTLPVEFADKDFGHICEDAVDEVRAARPDARIEIQLAGDLTGMCDSARVDQLLINLLTNAVNYGVGTVRVNVADHGDLIQFSVSNRGPGIPAKALPTIFDPLTRAGSSEQRTPSSGIGRDLYICRCIAHAHWGTIDVESSDSMTVFTVKLPRIPAQLP